MRPTFAILMTATAAITWSCASNQEGRVGPDEKATMTKLAEKFRSTKDEEWNQARGQLLAMGRKGEEALLRLLSYHAGRTGKNELRAVANLIWLGGQRPRRVIDYMIFILDMAIDPSDSWIPAPYRTPTRKRLVIFDMNRFKEHLQRNARRVLVGIGSPAVTALLDKLERSRNVWTRGRILLCLGEIRERRALGAIVSLLKRTSNLNLRDYCIHALGDFGGDEVLPHLEHGLEESDPGLRESAVAALMKNRSSKVIGPLVRALEVSADDFALRVKIVARLRRLSGKRFGLEAGEWRRWLRDRQ